MDKEHKNITYTVSELIAVLQQFPQDLAVVVSGYESGYENLLTPQKAKLENKPENGYWDGEFQTTEHDVKEIMEAVILRRKVRNV